jgi:hypothetical protein
MPDHVVATYAALGVAVRDKCRGQNRKDADMPLADMRNDLREKGALSEQAKSKLSA